MSLRLYSSLTKQKEDFVPLDPERVTLYVCGPTVYSYAHIGNGRSAVVFDLLYRRLCAHYENVVYARNITDVDDKINAAAAEQGVDISVITEKFADIYRQDMGHLGVQPPTIEPKATEHIPQMLDMIQRLIDAGHAYAAEGHVLFNVPSFEKYGALSRRDRREQVAGARVEVAPFKQDPADFVLWKPSADDLPGWDSPWGRGRPGWHLECSAMVEAHLGETIDIHGGGVDLTFPHHENEIAQSRCAHGGADYARYWLHNGFVMVEHEKMSKSLGNVVLVHDLVAEAPGEARRLALLATHYRQPLDWTADGVAAARKRLDKAYAALRQLADVQVTEAEIAAGLPERVGAALDDDLNTPLALTELFVLVREANTEEDPVARKRIKAGLLAAGAALGLLAEDPEAWFQQGGDAEVDAAAIDQMIVERDAARAAKNWAEADRLRDELAALKVVIEDGADGSTWRIAS